MQSDVDNHREVVLTPGVCTSANERCRLNLSSPTPSFFSDLADMYIIERIEEPINSVEIDNLERSRSSSHDPAVEENPINHSPDMVPETQQNIEIDKGIEETQTSKQLLKKRKNSERILKIKLSQQIGSTGASSGDPITID
ncbi:hypothetical protein L2E82_27898 [Cichorium intybus]|uniref:Uncharacterized protein n=1 Tax=Cichorium intybus TaxID=13427 RepID=A0ACB9CUQ6_CICIN|nr:hypothetical protein L2E82_27898 [Cichorium intybus]